MPPADHFALLGFPVSFDLDAAALHEAYVRLQRLHHPDKLSHATPKERMQAIQRSADLNQAYRTLKDPLSRAEHALALQGVLVGSESGAVKPSSVLLMESMDLRERLMEADGPAELDALQVEASDLLAQSREQFGLAYAQADWPKAAQAVIRWRFLEKFQAELRGAAARQRGKSANR